MFCLVKSKVALMAAKFALQLIVAQGAVALKTLMFFY
jgi:hypothetical protein